MGAVIELVSQPLYVLLFGIATYGLYSVLWAAVNLIQNVVDLGMPSALQRLVPQAADDTAAATMVRAAFVLGVVPSVAVAVIVCVAAGDVAVYVNVAPRDRTDLVTAIEIFAWALPLWSIIEVGSAALRARQAFGPEIRLRIFWEQVVRLAVAVALWLAGVTTLGIIIAHLVSLALTAIATVRLVGRQYDFSNGLFAPIPRRVFADATRSGLALLPLDIVGRLLTDAPPIILNAWLPGAAGATAAGLFAIARKISSLVQIVRTTFSYVMSPLASAAAREGNVAIQPIYEFATRISVALTLPIAAVTIAAGPLILRSFGSGAATAYGAMVFLTIARAIEAVLGQAIAIQQVVGGHGAAAVCSIAGLAVAIASGFVLVESDGLTGIAASTALGIVTTNLLSAWWIWQRQRLQPFAPPFGSVAARATLVAGFAAVAASAANALPLAAGLIIAAGILLVAAAVAFAFALTTSDRDAFRRPP